MTSVVKWIEDGVEITLKRKKLCSLHIAENSTGNPVPTPDPVSTPDRVPTANPVPTPDSVPTPDPIPDPVPTPDLALDPTSTPSSSSSALDLLLDPAEYDGDVPNYKDLEAALANFDPQPTSSDSSSKMRRNRMTRERSKIIK